VKKKCIFFVPECTSNNLQLSKVKIMTIQVFRDVMIHRQDILILRHSVMSQKALLFSDIAVRTSILTLTKNAVRNAYYKLDSCHSSGFGGLVVNMLASGIQDRGFAPGQSHRIFLGQKILSMPSFGREVKPFAPCRRSAACQRTL
jgi:hypothetical protein